MKKTVITIIITFFLLISMPTTFIILGFALPPQYNRTYYAVLSDMYQRLLNAEGKRIIVIGNSSVAFGLQGKLMQNTIEGYVVCPFGLYGAIGTKTMMDIAKNSIREGDIIILAPEQAQQSMSLYFNAEHYWKAVDNNFELLKFVAKENQGSMVGNFIGYAVQKYNYWKHNSAPTPLGVYTSNSFDNGTMTFERPYNQMQGGYNPAERIDYSTSIISKSFVEYVNQYNSYIVSKKATLLFGFSPVNVLGISPNTNSEDIDNWYDYLIKSLKCEILGNPKDYIMEFEWFYDSNVHCNTAGSIIYTRQLVKDLKVYLGDSSPIKIEFPKKPVIPEENSDDDAYLSADNADGIFFEYEEVAGGVNISGITAEGMKQTSLTIPAYYNGNKVVSFSKNVFIGNSKIKEVKFQFNIRSIQDGSFNGCINLAKLYVPTDTAPSRCIVLSGLLEGAPNCKIYIRKDLFSSYTTDYFWAKLTSYMVSYS